MPKNILIINFFCLCTIETLCEEKIKVEKKLEDSSFNAVYCVFCLLLAEVFLIFSALYLK